MRILFINQCYWPDYVATSQVLADLTEELVLRGHEVAVVCSRKPYAGGSTSYPKQEYHNGVLIRRVANPGWGKRAGTAGRFGDAICYFTGATLASMRLPTPDVVVTLSSPPLVGVVGRIVQLFKHASHVHWCMDVFPDNAVEFGVLQEGGWIHKACVAAASFYLRSAEIVAVLSTHMATRIRPYGVHSDRLRIVPVWSDGRKLKSIDRRDNPFLQTHSLQGKFVLMFSGNLTYGGDIDTLVKALVELQDDKDLLFVLISEGPRFEEFRDRCQSLGLQNVLFLPYQNREELSYSLSAADVHLITNKKGLEGVREPCKVYGVLAVGRPFILIGGPGCVAADIAYENGVGVVIEEGDVAQLVSAIRRLKESPERWSDMCRRSREIFEERHDALHAIGTFEKAALAAVSKRRGGRAAADARADTVSVQDSPQPRRPVHRYHPVESVAETPGVVKDCSGQDHIKPSADACGISVTSLNRRSNA